MSEIQPKKHFYSDEEFYTSPEARSLRILSEYLGPRQRFSRNHIEDTIVFFGSARLVSKQKAEQALKKASTSPTLPAPAASPTPPPTPGSPASPIPPRSPSSPLPLKTNNLYKL